MTTEKRHTICAEPGHGITNDGTGRPVCQTCAQAKPVLTGKDAFIPIRLPTDAAARKNTPMARGLLDYFPRALAAVAELSQIGNEQHNPGQPLHWAREKSTDHADCIVRHLVDRGTLDTDGVRHSTKVAWRALANLEIELEESAASGS